MQRHTREHIVTQRRRWVARRIRFWRRAIDGRRHPGGRSRWDHDVDEFRVRGLPDTYIRQPNRFAKRSRKSSDRWFTERDDWFLDGRWRRVTWRHADERIQYGETFGRRRYWWRG